MKLHERQATLAIGPANYAGQAYRWASAVRDHLAVASTSFAPSEFVFRWPDRARHRFPVHQRLPHHRLTTPSGKRMRMRRVLADATHLAADGFLSVHGRFDINHLADDLDALRQQGLKLALIAHGSDVRDPDAHMRRYDYSYYRQAPAGFVERLRRVSARNRALAVESGLPLFVSTPDLLIDVPFAQWLPLCIDPAAWSGSPGGPWSGAPAVLHLPSKRVPPIKGTDVIDQELRILEGEGLIRYLAPEAVSNSQMPALVKKADIVVDQIRGGYYGVASVEAMAAGKLVVCAMGADVVELMSEPPPVVSADPSNFRARLLDIIAAPDASAQIAAKGPDFVKRWHNGQASAAALKTYLLS